MNHESIYNLIINKVPNMNSYKENMIKRYLNFIRSRKSLVQSIIERHHILPKSIFPEYRDLSVYSWNSSKLTLREHFIAHLMLHFIFGGKMTYALYHMIPQSIKKYSYEEFSDELAFKSRWYEYVRMEYRNVRKGYGTYKDDRDKTYFLHRDDPIINELNLTWHMSGYKFSDVQKKKMLEARNGGRGTKIRVYFMRWKRLIYKDELNKYIDLGWNTLKNSDDESYLSHIRRENAKNAAEASTKKLKDGMRIMYDSHGKSYGFMYPDDPRIKKLHLSKDKKSENMIDQRKRFNDKSIEARKGSYMYTNGIEQRLIKGDDIPDGWYKGSLNRKMRSDVRFNWNDEESINTIIFLLEKYSGELEKVGAAIGIRGVNVKKNIKKYMPSIDYRKFWIPIKRYKVDKEYAMDIYHSHNGDYYSISKIIGTNPATIELNYKKLWLK